MRANIRSKTIGIALSCALFGAVFTPSMAWAQGRVSVVQKEFAREGDSVKVSMEVKLNGAKISPRNSVVLTPVIKSGSVGKELPSVLVKGSRAYKSYRRSVVLGHAPADVQGAINASDKKGPQTYSYSATIPYERWMRGAEFALREDQCECNGPLVQMTFEMLTNQLINRSNVAVPAPYAPKFVVSYVIPAAETVKARSETGKAYLDFQVGKSTILPDFRNNRAELDKVYTLVELVRNDPYATITNIAIVGYASPEGTYSANKSLSERRAAALREHVRTLYGYPSKLFTVTGQGEDWAGLDTLVSTSDMAYKDEILAIVRGTDIFDGREKKLMNLYAGNPYRQMKEEIFPRLRRTDYELKYIVRPLTIEESKAIIKTRPSSLSLNEMFLVAQTYTPGSDEFNEIFEIAARMFPASEDARLNAAANALARGEATTASRYLRHLTTRSAAYCNNMGVLLLLEGKDAQAADYFVQAKAAGSAEATTNTTELDKLNANRAEIKRAMELNENW